MQQNTYALVLNNILIQYLWPCPTKTAIENTCYYYYYYYINI